MTRMTIGRLDFEFGGETLTIHQENRKLCTVPLAEVLEFARVWEREMGKLCKEKGVLFISPSVMNIKVQDYASGEPLAWD